MEDKEEKKPKGLRDKLRENAQDELEILGTFVRLGVVVWSGFI